MKQYRLPLIFSGGICVGVLVTLYLNDYLPTFEQLWYAIKVTLISLFFLFLVILLVIHDKKTDLRIPIILCAGAWFVNLFGCT